MTARIGDPKLALLVVVAVVLSVAGLYAAMRGLAPAPIPPSTVSVTLHIEASDWNLSYAATTTNNTVLGLLVEASAVEGFPIQYQYWEDLGASRVDVINGVRNGAGGLWWQYWVNGEYGPVGADRYILENGDAVLWRHTVYPPEA